MKAFKVKRGKETYYRVELPQNLCPDGKRHSVMGKSRNQTVAKANEEMARRGTRSGSRRRQEDAGGVPKGVPRLL